jgi:hypothetical protein
LAHLPFAVPCARCGEDLRGLQESKCAACGLEFAWEEAVPPAVLACPACQYSLRGLRDGLCPECGTEFTWNDLLDSAARKMHRHFEYVYRRQPVRGLLYTARRLLRPGRFWQNLHKRDPVQVKPLVGVIALTPAVDAALWIVASLIFWYGHIGATWLMLYLTRGYIFAFPPFDWGDVLSVDDLTVGILGMSWATAGSLAMLVFQQSMRRYHVRPVHLLRLIVYCWVFPLLACPVFGASILIAEDMLDTFVHIRFNSPAILAAGLVGYSAWATYCAYRHYLKLPHATGIAAALAALAVLGGIGGVICFAPHAGAVQLLFDPLGYGRRILGG